MAKHVQGSAVANATSYKLYNTGTGAELMTQSSGGDIDFDLSTLSLAAGTYSLAVKAFDSTGTYATSDFSNTVSYTAEGGGGEDVPLKDRVVFAFGTVNDKDGSWLPSDSELYKARIATTHTIHVQPGDSISIPEDAGYRFILVPYTNKQGAGIPQYIDCNAADSTSNLKNWGYSYTFPQSSVTTTVGTTVNYPLYVRIILRADDNGANSTVSLAAKDLITYNISADNSHIEDVTIYPPYQQGTMTDITGEIQTNTEIPTYATRVCVRDIFQVQPGDSVSIPEGAGYRFIFGCYSDTNGTLAGDGSALQYIDCNAADNSSNAKNWGYSYTFPEGTITSTAGQTISYPLFVRIAFRKDDNGQNGAINAEDLQTLVTYNISADNPDLPWLN